jgi:hypothetical protein
MAGGIAIGLLVILVVLIGAFAIGSYLTGGVLWFGKTDPKEDRIEGGDDDDGGRPLHTRPTTPALESTAFVGTPRGDRARERD